MSSKLFHVIIFTLITFSIVAVLKKDEEFRLRHDRMTGGAKAKSVFAI